jgi:Na+-transporting NADH:ubiquinone oxidoreductase subunit F
VTTPALAFAVPSELWLGALVFAVLATVLALLVLGAESLLSRGGVADVHVEGHGSLRAPRSRKLLSVLTDGGIAIPAVCGGRGTCGLCRVTVVSGDAGQVTPTESAHLRAAELARGMRLACQATVRGELRVRVEEDVGAARSLTTLVHSSRNVTALLREVVLRPEGAATLEFRPGQFVLVTCPPYRLGLHELPVDEPFREEWERLGVDHLVASCDRPTTRAYSLAAPPAEDGHLTLLVKVAVPPPTAVGPTRAGTVSTWLACVRPGDRVSLTGPYGQFVPDESDRELVFVGGGAGMAPLRAHIHHHLLRRRTSRTMSLWYGAKGRRDLPYAAELDRMMEEHANFRWVPVLSEARPDDAWTGPTGFVHAHLRTAFLERHAAPGECVYFLCGPPAMLAATREALSAFGIDPSRVHFDDFGA